MLEENVTLYQKLDDGKIDTNELIEAQKRAGKILIVSMCLRLRPQSLPKPLSIDMRIKCLT